MNQSGTGERMGATVTPDVHRLDTAEVEGILAQFEEILGARLGDSEKFGKIIPDYSEMRDTLGAQHAERSRKFIEGEQTAESIRNSREEVTEYINGLATELYLHYSDEGMSEQEIASEIDTFITLQTHLLLGEMADKRSQAVRSRSRFIPKALGSLYDSALEKWRSWEVPTGDGELVGSLRQSEMWQHLEQKTAGTTRGAKLGRFALNAFASSVNGIESLKHSGARKRLAAMAGVGIASGITAGAAMGAVGAGAAGAFMVGLTTRTMVRFGLSTKLNSDANIDQAALYDQVRMQGRIEQMTGQDQAYSVDELLTYVDGETKKMLHDNDVKLMGGVAIGIVGGLLGNGAARTLGWAAEQYVAANFNVMAHAEVLHHSPNHVVNGTGPAPDHVVHGENPDHVIDGLTAKAAPDHVIDGTDTLYPNHVIDGLAKPSDVADNTHPNHVIDGLQIKTEVKVSHNTFYVESGHGFIREIQDYAKANGYGKISSAEAFHMHKLLLGEHGKNGLIDVHGIKQDTYVENGDVRISAAGKANWRTGVEGDLKTLMHQHADDEKLTLHSNSNATYPTHVIDGLPDNSSANHVVDGTSDSSQPDHVTDGVDSVQLSSSSKPTAVVDGGAEAGTQQGTSSGNETVHRSAGIALSDRLSTGNSFTAHELTAYGDGTKAYQKALAGVAPHHRADILKAAAPELQSFKLTEKVNGVWRYREVGAIPPKAVDILSRIATKNHWTLAA